MKHSGGEVEIIDVTTTIKSRTYRFGGHSGDNSSVPTNSSPLNLRYSSADSKAPTVTATDSVTMGASIYDDKQAQQLPICRARKNSSHLSAAKTKRGRTGG